MNTAKIEHAEIPKGKRILVTSDIHGHLTHLKKILEKASFSKEDILIIVGDIVEKGPESLKTLRYIMELWTQGNVMVSMGNVDALRLQMIQEIGPENIQDFYEYFVSLRKWKGTCFFDELTQELGYLCQSPQEILKAKKDVLRHFSRELDFLAGLPTAITTQNYVFVHGGLPEQKLEDNKKRPAGQLLKYDHFLYTSYCFDQYVVVGHWPVSLYSKNGTKGIHSNPIFCHKKKIISIDGGCGLKRYGQLNLLILPEIDCPAKDIHFICYDGLPVIRALDFQKGSSEDSVNILWGNNDIRILEKGKEFSYILHTASHRKLWVPTELIIDDRQCTDYTDYALPVCPGDSLSLIKSTSKGHMVKKNGVTGWYYGRISMESLS